MLFFIALILSINLLSSGIMAADKHNARTNRQRIPEKVLLVTALCGGGFGALAAAHLVRHKTRHLSFQILLPVGCMTSVFIYIFLYNLMVQNLF